MTGTRRSVLPFIVGISGKRDLGGRDEAVRTALRALFARLDERCPHTDKILLSGLAEGADILAAEAALDRPHWRVVATLPLAAALCREDFPAGATEHPGQLEDFERLLADARILQRPLKPLRDRPAGRPLADAALRRAQPDASNPLRTPHYEQLGLFLARYCGLLIAVMDQSEQPDRLGGTARVVRHRLEGAPDAQASAVMARSDEVVEEAPLDDPETGPLWLIDLGHPDPSAEAAFVVRLPSFDAPGDPSDRLDRSLAGADWIENLNRRASRLNASDWEGIERRADGAADAGAGALLRLCRYTASAVQRQTMARLRASIWVLALLFLLAIAAYELFVELKPYAWTRWMSWVYLGAVSGAVAAYMFAARHRWQRIAEEFRVFSEALRVQLVWWDAGLTGPRHRVDEFHLRGLYSSHAAVRTALSQAVTAALIADDPPKPRPGEIRRWIEEQSRFFALRARARLRSVGRTEEWSWFLFAASLGAAICLAAMQTRLIELFAPLYSRGWGTIAALALLVALLFCVVHASRCFLHEEEAAPRLPGLRTAGRASAVFAGIILSLGLCVLAGQLPQLEAGCHGGEGGRSFIDELAIDLVAIAVILPAAISGAIRFVAEKLSWVTELHAYEESLDRFGRGGNALSATRSDKRRREIVAALGVAALRENEAWLRAHRERPLEPVVGG